MYFSINKNPVPVTVVKSIHQTFSMHMLGANSWIGKFHTEVCMCMCACVWSVCVCVRLCGLYVCMYVCVCVVCMCVCMCASVWLVGGSRTQVECSTAEVRQVQRSNCDVDGMDEKDG